MIQGARIAGASRIFAVDPVEMKRKTAEQFGATDLDRPGARATRSSRSAPPTGGRGTDYAFEVIGLPETILQAYEVARARRHRRRRGDGALRRHRSPSRPWPCSPGTRQILGCMYGSAQVRRDFPRFVQLVETGRLDIGSMVSRHIHLDEVNEAFRAMEAGEVIRSVIV